MSFTELLENLETLTFEQRQQIAARLMEIDEPPLSPEIEKIIEERLAEHERNPEAAIPLEEFTRRLESRLAGVEEPSDLIRQTLDDRWEKFLANPNSALTLDQVKALMAARRDK